jgi:hypothetical protein
VTTRELTPITDPVERFAIYSGPLPQPLAAPKAGPVIAIVMEVRSPLPVDLTRFRKRVGCINSVSCRKAVFVDEASEAISTGDVAWSGRAGERRRWLLLVRRHELERAMWPVAVVVLDEDAKHSRELPSVEDEEPVQARVLSREGVGFANSGGLVFVDEAAQQVAAV